VRVVVGFGARAGVPAAALGAAVDDVLRQLREAADRAAAGSGGAGAADRAAGGSWEVAAVATLARRVRDPGVRQWAFERSWVLLGFPPERLARQRVPTPSTLVTAAVGTPSVAEAAALIAAGPGAVVLVPKTVSGGVTVAVVSRSAIRGPDGSRA